MCNFKYVILVDSSYRVLLVLEGMNFFIPGLPFKDDAVVDSDSNKCFLSFTGFCFYRGLNLKRLNFLYYS